MSCLFESLAPSIGGITAAHLRSRICDYLEQRGALFEDSDFAVDAEYVAEMRRASTFGGAIEIAACANLYGIRVVVKNERDGTSDIVFEPLNRMPRRVLFIGWSGNHYEPVQERV